MAFMPDQCIGYSLTQPQELKSPPAAAHAVPTVAPTATTMQAPPAVTPTTAPRHFRQICQVDRGAGRKRRDWRRLSSAGYGSNNQSCKAIANTVRMYRSPSFRTPRRLPCCLRVVRLKSVDLNQVVQRFGCPTM